MVAKNKQQALAPSLVVTNNKQALAPRQALAPSLFILYQSVAHENLTQLALLIANWVKLHAKNPENKFPKPDPRCLIFFYAEGVSLLSSNYTAEINNFYQQLPKIQNLTLNYCQTAWNKYKLASRSSLNDLAMNIINPSSLSMLHNEIQENDSLIQWH